LKSNFCAKVLDKNFEKLKFSLAQNLDHLKTRIEFWKEKCESGSRVRAREVRDPGMGDGYAKNKLPFQFRNLKFAKVWKNFWADPEMSRK